MRTFKLYVSEKPTNSAHAATLELTLLIGGVLNVVGSVSEVSNQGVCTAARWVVDQGFDVVSSSLCERASVHSEVSGRLAENT